MKKAAALLFLATLFVSTGFAQQECLIVRSAEGHRFRDSMIAGALTGGIGFAAGAAFGGAKYEYVDSFHMTNTKLKYKGGELQKLQKDGVHIIVINKKATSDETKSARESCMALSALPSTPTATASPTVNAAPAIPTAAAPAPATQPQPQSQPQQMSLAEVAKKNQQQKAASQKENQ